MRYPLLAFAALLGALVSSVPAQAQSGPPTPEQIYAQQRACESRKPPRKAKGTISEGAYKRLERVIEAIGKGEYVESEKKLKELQENARGEYEKAIVLQTLGFVYASQEKIPLAIKTFEQALEQNALPQQPHEQMMFNIAQLYVSDDKWDDGIKALQGYMTESCNPLPDAHILLASVYAERKRFRDSLQQVDLALAKAKTPKEPWLQLKLALHFELKEYPKCAEVLVQLVALVPTKEDYWKQLSGILFEVRKDPEALAALALAERRGYINEETEYKNLANLYMYMQVPLKAATILQRGVDDKAVTANEKNLESLGNAWLLAREYKKAEVAMKRAAEVSDKGELYKRLGQIQIENEDWKAALNSLTQAQKKGGVKEPGELAFLVGVVAVELKQWKRAEEALRAAMGYEKTAKIATEWFNHLQAEYAFHNPPDAEPVAEPAAEPAAAPQTKTN
ncbi:MAG: tetratricopeptide repeat protein [Hydrocarboniphaga effusa]|nr:tetratricopeptide repeat protein [Hydrocarboniphaga effusa]